MASFISAECFSEENIIGARIFKLNYKGSDPLHYLIVDEPSFQNNERDWYRRPCTDDMCLPELGFIRKLCEKYGKLIPNDCFEKIEKTHLKTNFVAYDMERLTDGSWESFLVELSSPEEI